MHDPPKFKDLNLIKHTLTGAVAAPDPLSNRKCVSNPLCDGLALSGAQIKGEFGEAQLLVCS